MAKKIGKKSDFIHKNVIFLSGVLSTDVKVHKTKTGINLASIRVEIEAGERKSWVNAVSFGECVDVLANCKEGDLVELMGHCASYKKTRNDGTDEYINSFTISKVISVNQFETSDITIPEMDDIPF